MKLLINILITALLAWLLSWLFAWWMIAVASFLVAVVSKHKPAKGFFIGFLGVGILWLYLILQADVANEHILSTKIAQLFSLSHTLFLIVNIFLGGLVGGLGGWSGASMRKLFDTGKEAK